MYQMLNTPEAAVRAALFRDGQVQRNSGYDHKNSL